MANSRIMDDDILTIDEVADYIRVSQRTVYDWAQKGQIPAGKIGTVWRFKKSEITRWLNERLCPDSSPNINESNIIIKNILSEKRVIFINVNTKREALIMLSGNLSMAPQIKNSEELEQQILKREELMSTAIGQGIAIPHVRLSSVTDLVMSVGICKQDVVDFHAIDENPVRIIIMIAAAYNQHSYYLKTLSFISSKLKNKDLRLALLTAKDTQEVFSLLTKE